MSSFSDPTSTGDDSLESPLLNDSQDLDPDSDIQPFESSHPRQLSNGSSVLESLPLLRRPSIYLDRTKTNVSLGPGRGPSYGSDDGEGVEDHEVPLVRVQSGVKKVEAITSMWTKTSLLIAYVRYSSLDCAT